MDLNAIIRATSFPSFKPLGSCIATTRDLRAGTFFTITTRVNGEQRQHAAATEMVFDFARIIGEISHQAESACGEIIFTGTPSRAGAAEVRYLSPGDVVEVEVDRIG